MRVDCAGCAGCCLDWRPLVDDVSGDGTATDPDRTDGEAESGLERPGRRRPSLDGMANLVPLTRDEVRAFVDAGYGAALTPRLWTAAESDDAVEVDGHRLAAIRGRPAFFVGLRKPPKPVAPFGRDEATWLPTCTFLDPTTLQCRSHEDDLYPGECGAYPAHNLALEQDTECERVERAFGGERLLDDAVETEAGFDDLLLGPAAVGGKLFCHPRPADLAGAVDRIADGDPTAEDRAEFVAVAAASSPGLLATSEPHYERARKRVLRAANADAEADVDAGTNADADADATAVDGESPGDWVADAITEWWRLASEERGGDGAAADPDPALAERVEDARGAPDTPGWE